MRGRCCMPCQPGRTRHTTRPNWVGPTLFVMEITPSLGSPDLGYSQKQNDSDLHAGMRPRSRRAKVTLKWQSTWRTRNRAKRIITSIQLCQEKKTYSHKQCHTSTQRQKSGGQHNRWLEPPKEQNSWQDHHYGRKNTKRLPDDSLI